MPLILPQDADWSGEVLNNEATSREIFMSHLSQQKAKRRREASGHVVGEAAHLPQHATVI